MVHVEGRVLASAVLDHEAVVVVEPRSFLGEAPSSERQQAASDELVEQRPKSDVVDDEAVRVHRVRPADREAARLVVRELVQ